MRGSFFLRTEHSSEDDSDALTALEDEARSGPITKAHVKAFDRMKKCRRYLDKSVVPDSDEDEALAMPDPTEEEFIEMFRNHTKRKKVRRKVRKMPEVREQFSITSPLKPPYLCTQLVISWCWSISQ